MSTTGLRTEASLVQGSAGRKAAFAAVAGPVKSVWRALRNRLSSSRLHELDDDQLDDIGLTRSDLVKALDGTGVLEDPSPLLSSAARRNAGTRFSRLGERQAQ